MVLLLENSRNITTAMIVRATAMGSKVRKSGPAPNTIGIGPISIMPPPLTEPAPLNAEMKMKVTPMKIRREPAMKSNGIL